MLNGYFHWDIPSILFSFHHFHFIVARKIKIQKTAKPESQQKVNIIKVKFVHKIVFRLL